MNKPKETLADHLEMIISNNLQTPFDIYYAAAKKHFATLKSFCSLTGKSVHKLLWPKEPGVYVIWDTSSTPDKVVYIGMTGKISTNGAFEGKQGLSHRRYRWTPYYFNPKNNCFCYGPKYRIGEKRTSPPAAGYRTMLPMKTIRIDCFAHDRNAQLAPTFLEALLLQGYLHQHGVLPEGNQKL